MGLTAKGGGRATDRHQALQEFAALCRGAGLAVEEIIPSGTHQRVDMADERPGRKSGWYVLYDHGDWLAGCCGSWKGVEKQTYCSLASEAMTETQRAAFDRSMQRARELAEAKRREQHEATAKKAAGVWERAKPCELHPYLSAKGVRGYGVRVGADGRLLVPMRDAAGKLWSLQQIAGNGVKRFMAGGKVSGTYHLLEPPECPSDGPLYVAEGYATAATVHEATGACVAVAWHASNLPTVVQHVAESRPGRQLVVAGDDDRQTDGNPGRAWAESCDVECVFPVFAGSEGTDWNDLARLEGMEVVRAQLLPQPEPDVSRETGPNPTDSASEPFHVERDGKGRPLATIRNIAGILSSGDWAGCIGADQFNVGAIQLVRASPIGKAARWTDGHSIQARMWLEQHYRLSVGRDKIEDAIRAVADANPYHPVCAYLDGLSWDGQERLKALMSGYFGAVDTEFALQIGRRWLLSAVARVRQPGCKVDTVLVLNGGQGMGKSSAFRVLFGPEWFSDTPLHLESKDAYQALSGRWCIELAELESLRKADSTRAKAFFSSSIDRYRPPYGRHVVDVPRQCVIVGTGNQHEYLRDVTGNRRYWPVACDSKTDLVRLERDRDQIWAEADLAFREGDSRWWIDADEGLAGLAEVEQSERRQESPLEVELAPWLESRETEKVTMHQIFQKLELGPSGLQNPGTTGQIADALRALGWERAGKTAGGKRKAWAKGSSSVPRGQEKL